MSRLESTPTASIIIPCHNHAPELARCIASLRQEAIEFPVETIVVDSSDDHAAERVSQRYTDVVLFKSNRHLRPGAARNLGAEMAKGKYLIFIDADCTAEPGWIREAVDTLDRGYRLIGGPVLHGDSWHPIAVVDNLMQFLVLDPGRPAGPVQLLATCNLALPKADFEATRGFPELEHSAGEDVLFFAEARARWPGELFFQPAMRVRHFGRTCWSDFWSHQDSFGYIRAFYALEIQKTHLRWGRFFWMTPAVATKRLFYLLSRSTRYPASLLYFLLLLPILVAGISAWSIGFHRGCRARVARENFDSQASIGQKTIKTPRSSS